MTKIIHTIDATNQKIGRVASKAAKILMGKDTTSYKPNVVSDISVHITNASKVSVDPKKLKMKEYETYSGYPGGLTFKKMENLVSKKGYKEIFMLAVRGMLPGNKLRTPRLKNLKITE